MTNFVQGWIDHAWLIPLALLWSAALAYLIWLQLQARKERREEQRLVNES